MTIEIEIEDEAWASALPDCAATAERAALAALDGEAGDVAILLAGDDAVQDLNARFRGKDRPTNVLSFPAAESARSCPEGAPHLGDVALAYGVCRAEAEAQGKSLEHHLAHLVVHGVLHLLGYDHETDAEAETMEGAEREVLARLGVPDPYAHPGDGLTEANA